MYILARPTLSSVRPAGSASEDHHIFWQLTEGLPLLVACYNATRRQIGALPPGLPEPSGVASREGFEQWLADLISNPALVSNVSPTADLGRFTFIYSMAILARSRHGLRLIDICKQFEQLALPYDLEVIRWLNESPLIISYGELLLLHADLLRLIDKYKSVAIGD